MDLTFTSWLVVIGLLVFLLLLDFVTVSRKPHEVMFKEASLWSIFYIAVAIIFGGWVWLQFGSDYGTEYFAAYLVEKSLSVDNIFVFAIILTQFAVPVIHHQRVLLFGVILAIFMRAAFIAIGAVAIARFSFTFVLFGALLVWTGAKLMQHWDEDPDPSENGLVRFAKRRFRFSDQYDGSKSFTKIDGKRYATPMLLVMIAIASTDLLFALDSIPATFGVTQEPFLVFSANAFALLGLRALFFLLQGLLNKLVYLSLGLAFILIFIGIKLILLYAHEVNDVFPKIQTNVSLVVIALILIISSVASLIKVRKDPSAVAHAGRTSDPKKDEPEE
jgi:tellurite resistance protein TerC